MLVTNRECFVCVFVLKEVAWSWRPQLGLLEIKGLMVKRKLVLHLLSVVVHRSTKANSKHLHHILVQSEVKTTPVICVVLVDVLHVLSCLVHL